MDFGIYVFSIYMNFKKINMMILISINNKEILFEVSFIKGHIFWSFYYFVNLCKEYYYYFEYL